MKEVMNMETQFACHLVLSRWEQFGYQPHATLEAARAEARRVITDRSALAVEIIKIEYLGDGRFSHTVVETVTAKEVVALPCATAGEKPSDAEALAELRHDLEGAKSGDPAFGPPPWMTLAEHIAYLEGQIARYEGR